MNKEEERILHGLYYHRQMIGEEMLYNANEIKWLAKNSFHKGKEWQGSDGQLKSIEDEDERYLVSAASKRPLTYLEKSGYISFKVEADVCRIALTVAGADLARRLHTRWGRLDIRYEENKDRILGLLVTVVVSIATAIVTTIVTNKYLK